jgi:hypothetical protein
MAFVTLAAQSHNLLMKVVVVSLVELSVRKREGVDNYEAVH